MKNKIISVLAVLGLSTAGLIAVATPASAWSASATASAACQVVDGSNTGKAVISGTFNNTETRFDNLNSMNVTMSAAGQSDGPKTVVINSSGSFSVVVDAPLSAGTANFALTWTNRNGTDSRSAEYNAVTDCTNLATPVAPEVTESTQCEVDGSVTPAVTRGVVYTVGGTSPTAITVTATPAQGYRFAESQQVVYGPYDVSSGTCPTPTPDPTPPPQPEPPKDFCPDLEAVQWENYDCNPVVATPEPTPTPTVEPTPVPTPEPTVEPTTKPTKVPAPGEVSAGVPTVATMPQAVPAGDGSTQENGYPWFAVLIGAIVGCFAGAIIAAYNLKNK